MFSEGNPPQNVRGNQILPFGENKISLPSEKTY